MKRVFSFFLCILMCAALCGCSKGKATSSEEASTASAIAAVSEIASASDTGDAVSKEESNTVSTVSEKEEPTYSEPAESFNNEADVKPAEIPNPSGITSTGRKNNTGNNWKLTIVNPWNTLDNSYSVDLAQVDSRFGEDKYFDSRAVKYLNNMCEAAANDGVSLYAISTFRTFDYQQMLFDNEIAEYKANHPGCSQSEAETGAATEVARPGTSEHNLGLAVDFNSVEQSFENTDAFSWLNKHCNEYGFILRYSVSTQSTTGVIYEPWHYRFVGVDNAKKIAASGLCLEDYMAKK